MNAKRRYLLLVVLALAASVTLAGCKKKEEPAPPPAKAPAIEEITKQAEKMKETAIETAEEAKKEVMEAAAKIEQTMCPIMDGNKIDKNVFVEYKGKKVYFCCPGCKEKFLAEPEKYTAELPQFNK